MRTPPPELAAALTRAGEEILTSPDLRLEDVARMVGASRAKLYYYFAGLPDLHGYLVEQHLQEGARTIRDAVDPALDAPDRLHAVVRAAAAYLAERPGLCAGLLGDDAVGTRAGMLAASDAVVGTPLRELLDEGRADGSLRAPDVATAVDSLMGAVLLAVLGRWRRGDDGAVATFASRVADQVVSGLRSTP